MVLIAYVYKHLTFTELQNPNLRCNYYCVVLNNSILQAGGSLRATPAAPILYNIPTMLSCTRYLHNQCPTYSTCTQTLLYYEPSLLIAARAAPSQLCLQDKACSGCI